jgi:hypothetical protein
MPTITPLERWRDDRLGWMASDCRNKACIDGGVSVDDGRNCTYHRCPVCDRSPVPSAGIFTGPIDLFTDEEMAARLKDRKDVYFDKENRYRRGKEVIGLLKSLTGGEASRKIEGERT